MFVGILINLQEVGGFSTFWLFYTQIEPVVLTECFFPGATKNIHLGECHGDL